MKAHFNYDSSSRSHIPYTIKISTKNNLIDQKRGLVELKPGYHVVIRVVPKIVETTEEFEVFSVNKRKCKLPHESHDLMLLKNYTKTGCEFECALRKAIDLCKCFPWFYPNNFTQTPMCDMFGAKCFDMVMSNDKNYKGCKMECLEDCKGTSYVAVPSYVPLDLPETCDQPLFKDLFTNMRDLFYNTMMFEYLTMGKWKTSGPDGEFSGDPNIPNGVDQLCQEYLKKYISIVSIETPTDTVTKSKRVRRVSFNEKLASIGGTLGLFTGMSLLSMVEVVCFCLTIAKNISQAGQTKLGKKTTTKDVEKGNHDKEETEPGCQEQ